MSNDDAPFDINEAIRIVYDARKNGGNAPDGKRDKAGRWFPSAAENADDLTRVARSPIRAWPHSYYRAACSRRHIKALAEKNLDYVLSLARAVKAKKP